MRVGLLLVLVALVGACAEEGPAPVADRIARWEGVGKQAFAAGKWEQASEAYHNLFSLLNPSPESADARAWVAFRIGRIHATMAEEAPSTHSMINASGYAHIWLREALALRPTLHQVWFERARLRELELPDEQRSQDLIAAYEAYLQGARDAGTQPGPEETRRMRLAEARLKALDK